MNKFYVCGVTIENKSLSLNKLEVCDDDFLKVCYDFIGTNCVDVRQIDLHDVDKSIPQGTWIDVLFDDEFLFKDISKDNGDYLLTRLPNGTEILGNLILTTSNEEGETCEFPNHYVFHYMDKWVQTQAFSGLSAKVAQDYIEEKMDNLDIGFVAL